MNTATSIKKGGESRIQARYEVVPAESRIVRKALQSRLYEAALSRIQLPVASSPSADSNDKPRTPRPLGAFVRSPGHDEEDGEPQPRPPPPGPQPYPNRDPCVPLSRFSLLTGRLEQQHSANGTSPAAVTSCEAKEEKRDAGVFHPAASARTHLMRLHIGGSEQRNEGPITSTAWLKSFEEKQPAYYGLAVVQQQQQRSGSGHDVSAPQQQRYVDVSWTSEEVVRNRQKQQLLETQRERQKRGSSASSAINAGASPSAVQQPPAMTSSPFYQPYLAAKRDAKEKRRVERQKRKLAAVSTATSPADQQQPSSVPQLSTPSAQAGASLEAGLQADTTQPAKAPSLRSLLSRNTTDNGRSSLFSGLIAAGDMRVLQLLLPNSSPFAELDPLGASKTISASRKGLRCSGASSTPSQTYMGNSWTKLCIVTAAEEKVSRLEMVEVELRIRREMRHAHQTALAEIALSLQEEERSTSDCGGEASAASVEQALSPADQREEGEGGPVDHILPVEATMMKSPQRAARTDNKSEAHSFGVAAETRDTSSLAHNSPGRAEVEAVAVKHALTEELERFSELLDPTSTAARLGGTATVMSTSFVLENVLSEFGALYSSDFPFLLHAAEEDGSAESSRRRSVGDPSAVWAYLTSVNLQGQLELGAATAAKSLEDEVIDAALVALVEAFVCDVAQEQLEVKGFVV